MANERTTVRTTVVQTFSYALKKKTGTQEENRQSEMRSIRNRALNWRVERD
ncbi:hypothetical protein AB6D20_027665 (plasmid) [Vibrio splendidus]